MKPCEICGSYAINDGMHGRKMGVDLDLCDICYWRKRANENASKVQLLEKNIAHLRKRAVEFCLDSNELSDIS